MSEKVVKRIWAFCDMPQVDIETIFTNQLKFLKNIPLGTHDKQKFVAKCHDGTLAMSGML